MVVMLKIHLPTQMVAVAVVERLLQEIMVLVLQIRMVVHQVEMEQQQVLQEHQQHMLVVEVEEKIMILQTEEMLGMVVLVVVEMVEALMVLQEIQQQGLLILEVVEVEVLNQLLLVFKENQVALV